MNKSTLLGLTVLSCLSLVVRAKVDQEERSECGDGLGDGWFGTGPNCYNLMRYYDLKEGPEAKAKQPLKMWKDARGDQATPSAMVEALKRMGTMTTDTVQKIEREFVI